MRSGGIDAEEARRLAYALLRREADSREAHLRLYEIEQMLGNTQAAVAHLRRALASSRIVTYPAKDGSPAVRVLALYRIAPWEANTPFELVVDERRTTVHRLYLDDGDDAGTLAQLDVPECDVVMNAIAESDRARKVLELAGTLAANLRKPLINSPRKVAELSRNRVPARFEGSANVYTPGVFRVTAPQLLNRPVAISVVVRPVGSQAGFGLAKIDNAQQMQAYVAAYPSDLYFTMPFVDYRSADGFYRKYRIMFVDGTPYAYHMAISPNWMIHYYNAPMAEHAWMREEEARFLDDLGSVFSGRLGAALAEIATAIPLTYFGIDCGIDPNGRLLLFEADAAMLVHGTDDPELFGYKVAAFKRVQAALSATIEGIAAGTIAVR